MKPNLVLFIAEDLDFEGVEGYAPGATGYTGLNHAGNVHASHLPPLEDVKTPHLCRLAEEGVAMDNYWCAAPVCTAARYTLFTGRYPERSEEVLRMCPTGQETVWFDASLSPGESSLPRSLHAIGYSTAYVGKFHNFPKPFHHELEKAYYPEKPLCADSQRIIREAYEKACAWLTEKDYGFDFVDRIYFDNPEPFRPVEISSHNPEWIIQGATNYIARQKDADRPFFLYTAVTVPHQRYSAERFASSDPRSSAAGYLKEPSCTMSEREKLTTSVREAGLSPNAVEGLWLDQMFGRVRDAVRAIGQDENTIYVFTTDHPTAGKGSCHLGKIPLIIRWPQAIPGGRRLDALLSETDLVPTLLSLLGEKADFAVDGISFLPLLTGQDPSFCPRQYAFMQIVNSRGVTDGRYKYIANRLPDHSPERLRLFHSEGWRAQEDTQRIWFDNHVNFPSYWQEDEFFDLAEDPLEQHNLLTNRAISHWPNDACRLRQALAEELRRMPHPFAELTEKS